MDSTIKGAIIGALITSAFTGAIAVYQTVTSQAAVEKKTVETPIWLFRRSESRNDL